MGAYDFGRGLDVSQGNSLLGGTQSGGGTSGSSGGDGGLGGLGLGMQAGAAVGSAVSSYYSVKAMQYRARSQALALDFQRQMSHVVARQAEKNAQRSLMAGQQAAGRAGLKYGQIKGSMRVKQAASGVQAGVGSAGEIAASIEYAKEADQLVITRNAVQEANAHRTGKVNALNRGRMAGASAVGLRAGADALNPGLAGVSSLVGGGGRVASSWYQYKQSQ